ncbi:tyrosine kinase domain-containing protein [Phanerochaete sordida]|uniref:Tyrosine kinase domain-containing protein n=1 Tax=Phanerochaete sordida TaxID=48140 RepID=A0A9P3GL87_9APHY|nr:tyrosine kinase domain-containing protein [Phanerochaete sordida]
MSNVLRAATSQSAQLVVKASLSAANMSGLPGLSSVPIAVKLVQDKLKNAKCRQKECRRLAKQCGDCLEAFEDHLKHLVDLPPPIDEFIILLEAIGRELDVFSTYPPWKVALKDGDIKERLEEFEKKLGDQKEAFDFESGRSTTKQIRELNKSLRLQTDILDSLHQGIEEARSGAPPSEAQRDAVLARGVNFVVAMVEASTQPDSKLQVGGVAVTRAQFNVLFAEVNQAIKDFAVQTGLKLPNIQDLGIALRIPRGNHGGLTPTVVGTWAMIYKGSYCATEGSLRVAVKEYRGIDVRHAEKAKKRFVNAIKTWSVCKLYDHPNIHTVIGVSDKVLPCLALATEWAGKGDIMRYTNNHPEVSDADLYSWLAGAAEGMIHLHENNVVHGNLKGSNILIADDGRALVSDFFLSKILVETEKELSLAAQTVTRAPPQRWCAPEVVGGANRSPTVESDVWSFGMTMLEVLTGEQPFNTIRRDGQITNAVRTEGLRPPRPASERFSDELWQAMQECWHLEPKERTSMVVLRDVLRKEERLSRERLAENAPEVGSSGDSTVLVI